MSSMEASPFTVMARNAATADQTMVAPMANRAT
jgi:hypothetical protein